MSCQFHVLWKFELIFRYFICYNFVYEISEPLEHLAVISGMCEIVGSDQQFYK